MILSHAKQEICSPLKSKLAFWMLDSWSSRMDLLDVDLLVDGLRSLGDDDLEDAVLQAGLDGVLVNASGEGKGAVELADRAFADPELWSVSGLADFLFVVGGRDFGGGLLGSLS